MRSVIPGQSPADHDGVDVRPRASSKSLGRLTAARRVRPAYLKAGAGLVAVCGVGVGVMVASIGGRVPVLQVAVAVPAGQKVTAEDLKTAQVAADAGVGLIPASRREEVVGRVAAVPLVVGDLVTESKVGSSGVFPPPGQAVASAQLKAGAFPAELKAGDQVAVEVTPGAAQGASGQAAQQQPKMKATVISVRDAQEQGSVLVSLLTDEQSALQIGQAGADPVSVVVLAPGSASGS